VTFILGDVRLLHWHMQKAGQREALGSTALNGTIAMPSTKDGRGRGKEDTGMVVPARASRDGKFWVNRG